MEIPEGLTLEELAVFLVRRGVRRTSAIRVARVLFERAYYAEALRMTGGKRRAAARLVGVRAPNLLGDLRRIRQRLSVLGI